MQSKKTYTIQSEELKVQTRKIWKNIAILTIVFMLNYSAYNGLFAIQSSLHRDEGVGTTGASVIYITSTLTCLFLAPLMIKLWGQKWTIFAAFITFFIWIAANGIGTWGSMMTASVLNGLFTASLWAAEGSYTTELAKAYASIHPDVSADRMCAFFFGIFAIHFGLSGLIGDSISSSILMNSKSENFSTPTEDEIKVSCGLNDCPWIERNITYFDEPSKSIVWTLVGVYLILSLSAILLTAFCLDSLSTVIKEEEEEKVENGNGISKTEILTALLSCLRLMKKYRLWLLLPIDWYLATSYSFRFAEFNGSWITCALGIWMVGVINIPGHLTRIPVAPFTGYVSKKIGRIIPMTISITIGFTTLLILLFWQVNGEDEWVYFLLSILFAMHVATLDIIVTTVHGIAFINDTAAIYTCYNFFWAVFSAIPFGYSYHVCSDTKLYIVIGAFVICFFCYFILEWDIHKKNQIGDSNFENESPADGHSGCEMSGKDGNFGSQQPGKDVNSEIDLSGQIGVIRKESFGTLDSGKESKVTNTYQNSSYQKY